MIGTSCCLGEGLELCRVAEPGELGHQTLGFGFGCAAVKVVGAKVAMRRAGLHHVIDGGEDRSSNSADRLLRPAPAAQAMELRAVVAVLGAFGGPGTLHEHGLEPRSAFAQARRFAFAGTLVLGRLGAAQAQAMRCPAVGKRLMSRPISARMAVADRTLTPGIAHRRAISSRKGSCPWAGLFVHAFDVVSDLLIDLPDRRLERIPLPQMQLQQMQLQQKTVMVAQPAMQRVMERLGRRLDAALSQCRQPVRVALAGNHGFDDPPTAHTHQVAEDGTELDVGLFERLLDALDIPRLLAHQLLAGDISDAVRGSLRAARNSP